MSLRFLSQITLSLFILTLACWAAYSVSLDAPFYLDDFSSITNNAAFSNASLSSLFSEYGLRVIGYLTFWWDHYRAGLDPRPFHMTNTLIHMVNGWLVFALAVLLLKRVTNLPYKWPVIGGALVCSLLFVLHPLHSQAVSYIVQRLASLVTLFYLASIVSYIGFRTVRSVGRKVLLLSLALVAAGLALFTKQNAFSLPLVIIALEVLVFRTLKPSRLVFLAGIGLAILLLAYLVVPEFILMLDSLSRENKEMSRLSYLGAQTCIIWMYIGKFFWPASLHLEYNFGLEDFATGQIAIASLAHVTVILLAWVKRERFPLVAFGVLFFYITHLVESGVVPITDLVFEHRTYLPNIGLLIIIGLAVTILFTNNKRSTRYLTAAIAFLTVLAAGSATYARNTVWANPGAFYENELAHSPQDLRTLHNYSAYLLNLGDREKALELLERMFQESGSKIDGMMINTYLAALINARQYDKALKLGEALLARELDATARTFVLSNIGVIFTNLKQYEKAKAHFDQARAIGVVPVNNLIAYGYALYMLNELDRAEKVCQEILKLMPNHQKAKQLAAMIQHKAR